MYLNIVGEDLLFLFAATLFLVVVGWAWQKAKPYELPEPLPSWFKIWFLSVQIIGVLIPVIVLVWAVWQGSDRASNFYGNGTAVSGIELIK